MEEKTWKKLVSENRETLLKWVIRNIKWHGHVKNKRNNHFIEQLGVKTQLHLFYFIDCFISFTFFFPSFLWTWILTVGIRKVQITYDHISLRLQLLKLSYFIPVILNEYGNSQWRMQQLSNASFVNLKLLSLNHLMIFALNSILFEDNIVSDILMFVFS